MVCRQTADGIEGLQIWMAAANMLNKELQTADKEWSSILWIGWGLTIPYHNRLSCYKMLHRALDFTLTNKIWSLTLREEHRFRFQ
jgi:hypothetical protein